MNKQRHHERRVIKISNTSVGITLKKEKLEKQGIELGDIVEVDIIKED